MGATGSEAAHAWVQQVLRLRMIAAGPEHAHEEGPGQALGKEPEGRGRQSLGCRGAH